MKPLTKSILVASGSLLVFLAALWLCAYVGSLDDMTKWVQTALMGTIISTMVVAVLVFFGAITWISTG